MKPIRSIALIIAASLASFTSGFWFDGSRHDKPRGDLPEGATKASQVASSQFATFISPEKEYGDLGLFLSDIDNYTMTVDDRTDGYLITFLLKVTMAGHYPAEGEVILWIKRIIK